MRKILIAAIVLLALGAGLWFFIGRGPGTVAPGAALADADAPLAFVPADTPYLIANLERMPKATVDAFVQQSEPVVKMWRTQFDLMNKRMAADGADEAATRWARAFEGEFRDKSLVEAIAAMGLDMQAFSAVYGVGLVPVARLTLADPAAFRAFVARLEERSGQKIATGTVDGLDYWQFTSADAPLRGILALQGDHAVLTLAPVGDDAALRTLLGIERPAQTLRDGGALAQINRDYGFTPYATGYVDTARVMALVSAPATPLESAFFRALEIEKPAIDAVCQAEYAALAAAAPRLVMGYTKLEPKASHSITRIELRSDLAQDLLGLRAPMPGLDAADDSAFNFGFSLKLAALPPLLGKWTGAVSKDPWKCASLAELNQGFAEVGAQASNPAMFAAAPVFHGFHAIVTRFDMATFDTAPDVSGKLLIGSPNPTALVGMARGFVPPLAGIELKPDGVVQALPAMPGMPANLPAHVAMTDALIGIAVGAGEDATLKAAMQVDAAQQPLLVLGYSGAAFTQFAENMARSVAMIEDEAQRAESEQSVQMMRDMYALIGRIDMRVEFDERGIAIHQNARMN
jgi:hypothetical protein